MKNIMTTRRPLELLHMDLFGPNTYKSLGGNSFSLVIVDDFSRVTWVFFLDDKSWVQKIFKKFARKAENHFEVKTKKVRSDKGTEFKNANVDTFLDEEGISHEFSATYVKEICPRGNNKVVIYISLYHGKFLLFMLELY